MNTQITGDIVLREAQEVEFYAGIQSALDPVNEDALQAGGTATTSPQSRWFATSCIRCRHSFRLGDTVSRLPDGNVVHAMHSLPCAERDERQETLVESTGDASDFYAGVDETWPPPSDVRVIRLTDTDPWVAMPTNAFRRRACVVCGHTLRPMDSVIVCPCSPNQPRCQAAVHRDILHGLLCWEAWNPSANDQKSCPITGEHLNE